MQHHQCWSEDKHHTPWPASSRIPNAGQDVFGLLFCKCILMAHVQLDVCRAPRSFSTNRSLESSLHWCTGLLWSVCIPVVWFNQVPVGPFPSCYGLSEWQCSPLACELLPPTACGPELPGVLSLLLLGSLTKLSNTSKCHKMCLHG